MTLRDRLRRSNSSGAIRVLITDDEPQVRRALRRLLEKDKRFEVVGEAGDGSEAAGRAAELQPDAITLDLAMPDTDGLSAIPQLLEASPQSKIVVLSSMVPFENMHSKALEAGAHTVLNKYTPPNKLLKALADTVKE